MTPSVAVFEAAMRVNQCIW